MNAEKDLYNFLFHAVRGICDEQDHVRLETRPSGRSFTFTIFVAPNDLKFIYSKLRMIREIAIGIAQRNKALVTIVVQE